MFKHATDYTAAVVLTDAQLELISGGFNENIPTCPELPTIIHSGGGRPGPSCGPSFGPVSPGGSWTGI